ncbi:MAG: CDP-diacylglycerol---glycerol-3-phosphate 3-phosphatidyltransferase [Pseudonocardiales bacterium]|nr:CDP-diacylglycerol/glycerol-3-phosphate 3-phosphatidyltransferase [Pseudonocardia sp.]MDT7644440.1 CDP-diacylglycerol---glycerol-3-phosphate 3-phosphatidyltransferase [Pseudonocardiales bacterium]
MTTEPRPPLKPAESSPPSGLPSGLPSVEPAMAAPLQSVPAVVPPAAAALAGASASTASPGSSGEPALLNVANLLTLLRLALVPVFIAFLLVQDGHQAGWRLAATGVFAVAALTDRFDGEIARRRGLVTKFGTIADPIADKALIGAALIGLSALGDLPWWVTVVIAVRELGVTGLRFWVLRHGVIAASRGGKLKTLVQSLAIGFYVLPLTAMAPVPVVDWVRWWLMALAVALTLVTGGDYVLRALRLRARGLAAARAVTRAG